MHSTNMTGPCPALVSDLRRTTDWALIGTVRNNHSLGPYNDPQYQYNSLFEEKGGASNAAVIGSWVNPAVDECSMYWHTMQYYESGVVDGPYLKNSALPTEQYCYLCGWTYDSWTTWEYLMGYWAY
jgi:hypothetical protein